MKKYILLVTGLIIATVLGSIVFAYVPNKDKMDDFLKEKLQELKDGENISVIIVFEKEPFPRMEGEIENRFHIIPAISAKISAKEIRKLSESKEIKKVYLNKKVHILLDDSVSMIKADKVHSEGIDGTGVKVCIVDTGVDDSHPYLKRLIAEYDFVNNDSDATDDNGHGTHIGGIIASQHPTYKGVAPGSSLIAAKVLDASGSGNYNDVMAGIEWCVDNGANVISLSLGGERTYTGNCDDDILAILVNNVVADGVIVSVAAGNSGKYGISSPACASKAIAVGAVDKNKRVIGWSSKGSELDIVAPGVDIYSTYLNNGWRSLSGTSMATPHVAGVTALLLQTKPGATVDETADPVSACYECLWWGSCLNGYYRRVLCTSSVQGAGIVDAYEAYQSLRPSPTPTTTTTSSTTTTSTTIVTTTTTAPTTTTIPSTWQECYNYCRDGITNLPKTCCAYSWIIFHVKYGYCRNEPRDICD
ncbi:MAG: S8 family serine peptidase [Candidatus Aenigmarchaeota archaeon]|nr:S8 family serine peptidase [Candidatus Aenigmarchaeota archaeon]